MLPQLKELLERSFAHYRESRNENLPEWLLKSEARFRRDPKIDLNFDLDTETILGIRNSGLGKKIKSDIREGDSAGSLGNEVLAFYKPYVKTISTDYIQWGLHFRFDAIQAYATELLIDYKKLQPELTFGQLIQFLLDVLMTHEVEHATQELIGALEQSLYPNKMPYYLLNFGTQGYGRFTEISATQQEMLKGGLASPMKAAKARSLILNWSAEQLPANYRDWNQVSVQAADLEVLKSIAPNIPTTDLHNLRLQVGAKASNKSVKIPRYYWYKELDSGNIPTPFLRTVIDCKKMSRFLKKADGKSPLGVPITVKSSPDHDFQVVSPLTERPIKFSCHSWREVPEMVIGQLSEAFGAGNKSEFKKYLCAQL